MLSLVIISMIEVRAPSIMFFEPSLTVYMITVNGFVYMNTVCLCFSGVTFLRRNGILLEQL